MPGLGIIFLSHSYSVALFCLKGGTKYATRLSRAFIEWLMCSGDSMADFEHSSQIHYPLTGTIKPALMALTTDKQLYTHTPLGASQIRLLRLFPGKAEDPICGSIIYTTIDSSQSTGGTSRMRYALPGPAEPLTHNCDDRRQNRDQKL
jgi:hypothetical protein